MNRAAQEMMPIFHPRNISDRQEGFSLLEMLIVLSIMGVVLSLVGVRLVSSIESTRFVRTAESAIADIKLIRLQAVLDERSVVITGAQEAGDRVSLKEINFRRLNLPDDWTVTGDDISISKTGFCSGGAIIMKDKTNREIRFNLSAPKCDAERSAL